MTSIREDQLREGTPDTKQLTLKIHNKICDARVAKRNVLTFIAMLKRQPSEPMTLHRAQHQF